MYICAMIHDVLLYTIHHLRYYCAPGWGLEEDTVRAELVAAACRLMLLSQDRFTGFVVPARVLLPSLAAPDNGALVPRPTRVGGSAGTAVGRRLGDGSAAIGRAAVV